MKHWFNVDTSDLFYVYLYKMNVLLVEWISAINKLWYPRVKPTIVSYKDSTFYNNVDRYKIRGKKGTDENL